MKEDTIYKLPKDTVAELDRRLNILLEFCQINRIPFFASCAIGNDTKETDYLNIVYSAQSHSMKLHDDRIRKHMLIANGEFDVVPKREILNFDPFHENDEEDMNE